MCLRLNLRKFSFYSGNEVFITVTEHSTNNIPWYINQNTRKQTFIKSNYILWFQEYIFTSSFKDGIECNLIILSYTL